jgi:hypothetical protein
MQLGKLAVRTTPNLHFINASVLPPTFNALLGRRQAFKLMGTSPVRSHLLLSSPRHRRT